MIFLKELDLQHEGCRRVTGASMLWKKIDLHLERTVIAERSLSTSSAEEGR
jgi:hypothetical protein